VEGASKIRVGVEHGGSLEASVLGKDPSHDIAVLGIPVGGLILHPLVLGSSSKAHVGDLVLAIGNPFGLARTLTTGVISALERQIQAPNVPIFASKWLRSGRRLRVGLGRSGE
jgi:S1-C subfamily serine protease